MPSLPDEVHQALLESAQRSDCLLFGEVRGAKELPLLLADLLDDLTALGYGALAMEIPRSQGEPITRWASGADDTIPPFFAQPGLDGRGSEQILTLLQRAAQKGWQILCFDIVADEWDWRERDSDMADTLAGQWRQSSPGRKVVGVCGNLHSRLTPTSESYADLWPSFAACLQERNPQIVVHTVRVECHSGFAFNNTVQELFYNPIPQTEWREDAELGHSYALHLPQATAATYLAPPKG